MPPQVVHIDSKGRAITHVVHLKRTVDEVIWIDIEDAGPWWITFDKPQTNPPSFLSGSPFGGGQFRVPKDGRVKSGAAPGATALGTYKYNVKREVAGGVPGQITNDPDIEIE